MQMSIQVLEQKGKEGLPRRFWACPLTPAWLRLLRRHPALRGSKSALCRIALGENSGAFHKENMWCSPACPCVGLAQTCPGLTPIPPREGYRLKGSTSMIRPEMRKLPGEPNDQRSFALAPWFHLELKKQKPKHTQKTSSVFSHSLPTLPPLTASVTLASIWHSAWCTVRRCPASVWVHIQLIN